MLYNDNPFKILGASPTNNRREIARLAEDKALLLDSEKCADARTTLTNPTRRIAAEVHWFLDCTEDEVQDIDNYISSVLAQNDTDDYQWDKNSALTQLNIQIACLDAQNFKNCSEAKYYVLGISRLFEAVKAEDAREMINNTRRQAGFPEISRNMDVESALGDLRSEIRQALSQHLMRLPLELYTQIVTLISESYSGNQRYKGQAVLEDIVSEYQLFINDKLAKQGQAIIKTAKFIAMGAKKIDVSQAVSDLIDSLYAWDKLAQPLQLSALTKGSSHAESEEMLRALRELALKLHNDYGMSSESLAITKAIQEVFKELPEYIELLSNDNKTLTRLVDEKQTEEILSPMLEEVKKVYEILVNCPEGQRSSRVNNLIRCIRDANQQIKNQCKDEEMANTLRTSLGLLARSYAVDLHNEHERTEDSLKIINAIDPLFYDLPEVIGRIREDKTTLSKLLKEQETTDNVLSGIKDVENLCESVKVALGGDRSARITDLISKMVEVDSLIMSGIQDSEACRQVRERLAYMVRSVGIELHNTKNDSQNALRVITAVKNEFSDISELSSVFNKDISTLNNQILYQKAAKEREIQEEKNQTGKLIRGGVLIAIVALGIWISSRGDSSSSTSTNGLQNTPKPTSSVLVTPKPTSTRAPLARPENGKVFYCSTSERPSSFKVTNNSDSNYYMKFVRAGTNTKVITFFVRARSTAIIDMPAGNLELKYAYGSSWYGESRLFGENTMYARDEEYYDFTNYTWEISFKASTNSGQNMDVEPIDASEF